MTLIKQNVFGKSMKKYLSTCDNYYGRVHDKNFIKKSKNVILSYK